jgi:hypothetical protein
METLLFALSCMEMRKAPGLDSSLLHLLPTAERAASALGMK